MEDLATDLVKSYLYFFFVSVFAWILNITMLESKI